MKFLQLTDLHIHSNDDDNTDVQNMLSYVVNHYPEHRLIVTGDITDDGAEKQYENAYKMLKPFKDRLYLCPGNHDFGAMGNFYSKERAVRFDAMLTVPFNQGGTFTGDTTPVVNILKSDGQRIMLIALDSNLETPIATDFACGEIGEYQLQCLNTILTTSDRNMIKIVFFHHHLFLRDRFFNMMELKDAEQLRTILAGRVDVVLFGHKHVQDKWLNRDGIPCVLAGANTPEPDNMAWEVDVNAGKISSQRIRVRD